MSKRQYLDLCQGRRTLQMNYAQTDMLIRKVFYCKTATILPWTSRTPPIIIPSSPACNPSETHEKSFSSFASCGAITECTMIMPAVRSHLFKRIHRNAGDTNTRPHRRLVWASNQTIRSARKTADINQLMVFTFSLWHHLLLGGIGCILVYWRRLLISITFEEVGVLIGGFRRLNTPPKPLNRFQWWLFWC